MRDPQNKQVFSARWSNGIINVGKNNSNNDKTFICLCKFVHHAVIKFIGHVFIVTSSILLERDFMEILMLKTNYWKRMHSVLMQQNRKQSLNLVSKRIFQPYPMWKALFKLVTRVVNQNWLTHLQPNSNPRIMQIGLQMASRKELARERSPRPADFFFSLCSLSLA